MAMEAEAMEDVGMARVAVRVVEAWEEAMVWAVAVWFVLRVGQRQSEVMCGLCCCVPSGRQDEGLSERAVQMGIFHHMPRLAARLHHLLDRPTRCATSRTRSTSDPHRTELLRLAARLARPMGLHHMPRLAARLHHLLDRPTRCATSRTRSTSDPHRTELLRLAARLARPMGLHHMPRLAARLHHLLDRPTRCATSRTRSTSDPHRTELLRLAARLARPMGLHHQWGRVNCSSYWPILLVQQLFVHCA